MAGNCRYLSIEQALPTGRAGDDLWLGNWLGCGKRRNKAVCCTCTSVLAPDVALLIPIPQDFSFPSGHTLSSVIAATTMWCSGIRWLGMVGVVMATLMALSRLYLFVHFPSDIIAGIVLGVAIGCGMSHFCYKKGTNSKS